MPSIFDISPIVGTVTIRDKQIPVPGIGSDGVVYLLQRFPVLRAVLTRKELTDFTPDAMIAMAPEAVDAVIAVGLGHLNSPEAEEHIRTTLALQEKIAILEKILEVTLPQGVGPFVETLNRLGSRAAAGGWDRATSSAEPSSS